ncbi:MAG: DEAD/DEAH box helicase [Actinomycetota bacterium]
MADGFRETFTRNRPFPPDPFQLRAFAALDAGRSVLVAAPPGSGKTLVGEYAVEQALAAGRKAFYTTPLKALSNQKFGDFGRIFGAARVGLLTGDTAIRGDAPVVVMTTEVLRNMIYAESPALEGLGVVVLDEVHYLQDPSRGAVWEEVIIHLPAAVTIAALSATVSNAEEVAEWLRSVRGETETVIEERRPVSLVNHYLVGDRSAERPHLFPTFVGTGPERRPNPEVLRLVTGSAPRRGATGRRRLFRPWRTEVVDLLAEESMLPAIVFVFSRSGCDQAVDQLMAAGVGLVSAEERRALRSIAERRLDGLSDDDLDALDYGPWITGFEAGVAAPHAGMVPPMKEAVEEGFASGLLKVVFATETLALGINMPARTVVIERLSKFTGEQHQMLTAGEYTQLTGRAGRRGIDRVGNAVVLWDPFVPFDQVAALASRRTSALTSSFRPTYNMAANLVRRYSPEHARRLIACSFAQFTADREVFAAEREIERRRARLTAERAAAAAIGPGLDEYRRLVAAADAPGVGSGPTRIDRLRPGDVVEVARRGGRAVVLKHESGRSGNRVLAITTGRNLIRLGAGDLRGAGRVVDAIELPRPFAPRSAAFQRAVVAALRARPEAATDAGDADSASAAPGNPTDHPLHGHPGLRAALAAAERADRSERDLARLERSTARREDGLSRRFDRVLGILGAWGYVEGWELTSAGGILTGLNTEADLVLAEALREGHLDGCRPPELAALVSCFTFRRRGPERNAPPPRWPSTSVARRARAIDGIWRDLRVAEHEAHLPITARPDPGFVGGIHAWAAGEELAEILEDEEMTGGDFVRSVKQTIDLLAQLAAVAPDPTTAAAARAAAAACDRGVVAASAAATEA